MRKRIIIFLIGVILFFASMGNAKISVVQASEISGIMVELADKNKSWEAGEYFLYEDLNVYLTYDSGEKIRLESNEFLLEQEKILLQPGVNVITVKYLEFISYAEVFAQERKTVGLIGNLKENKKYLINSNIDIEECNIYLLYSNGEKKDVTLDCVIEGNNKIALGRNLIKINYYEGDVCYSTVLVVEGVEKYEELMPQIPSGAAMIPQEEICPTSSVFTGVKEGKEDLIKATTYPETCNKEQPNLTEYQEDAEKSCSYVLTSSIKGIMKKNKNEKQKKIYTKKNVKFTVKTNYVKSLQYQLVKKGKKKNENWKVWNKKLKIKKQGKWILYVRIIGEDGKQYIEKTNVFIIDKAKPKVFGVKSGKIYEKSIQISYKDGISGIKSATLNGENLKQNTKIVKNGNYRMKIVDRANNKKIVRFQVAIPKKKPTVTPSPTINPTEQPEEEEIPVTDIYCAKSIDLKEGEHGRLKYEVVPENATNTQVTFKSSDKSVATVSNNGIIEAKESGIAYIVVRSKAENAIYATCVVYVTKE